MARAARGTRKANGECPLTQRAAGVAANDDGDLAYVKCMNKQCGKSCCVMCLDKLVDELESSLKQMHGKASVVEHEVWNAFCGRAWRSSASSFPAFGRHAKGGGVWLGACPLCVEMIFDELVLPALLRSEEYLRMPPEIVRRETVRVRTTRVRCSGADAPEPEWFTIDVIVVKQLIDDDACTLFKCALPLNTCALP